MRKDLSCEYCNNGFTAKRRDAKFCSNACRQSNYLERQVQKLNNDSRKDADKIIVTLTDSIVCLLKRDTITLDEVKGLQSIILLNENCFKNYQKHQELIEKGISVILEILSKQVSFSGGQINVSLLRPALIPIVELIIAEIKHF